MKKIILFLLITSTLFSCIVISTSAETSPEISPYYANIANATLAYSILPSGLAMVGVTYTGYSEVFTQVRCEITLQKRFLGLFWFDVDIGMPDNTWVDYSTEPYGAFYHEYQLQDTGTYRAVFNVYFYGTTGVVDEISDNKVEEYG